MIKVIMFDLGDTLIDPSNRPLPHVKEALAAIAEFKTAGGKLVRSCLISDFTMMAPPATAAKLAAIFHDYLAVLDQAGLRALFVPVQKRVTLSTHAGVMKPDRRVFEVALRRLGSKASLAECLFISENAAHITHARMSLKMSTLQFRPAGARQFDFDDWAQAPALIAHLLGATPIANVQTAVRAFLAAQNFEVLSVEEIEPAGSIQFSCKTWYPISVPDMDDLRDIHVSLPITGWVARGKKGQLKVVGLNRPSEQERAETVTFVRSLATNGQIGGRSGVLPRRPTHEIQIDASGSRRLVRKGFSAI